MTDESSSSSRDQKRRRWEDRYRSRAPGEFKWLPQEAPAPLAELLERAELPSGSALDIGCGPGVITRALASRFERCIGFDIALAAIEAARAVPAAAGGRRPLFLIAAAPEMPFRDETFAFVVDRGCLQTMPGRDWSPYMRRVGELLVPGGLFQLYASSPRPPRLSVRAAKELGRRMLRRRAKIAERVTRSLSGTALELVELRPYAWLRGVHRGEQVVALLRRAG